MGEGVGPPGRLEAAGLARLDRPVIGIAVRRQVDPRCGNVVAVFALERLLLVLLRRVLGQVRSGVGLEGAELAAQVEGLGRLWLSCRLRFGSCLSRAPRFLLNLRRGGLTFQMLILVMLKVP